MFTLIVYKFNKNLILNGLFYFRWALAIEIKGQNRDRVVGQNKKPGDSPIMGKTPGLWHKKLIPPGFYLLPEVNTLARFNGKLKVLIGVVNPFGFDRCGYRVLFDRYCRF